MAKKTDPQKRAGSAIESMCTSENYAMADDLISRGWNPFLPQERFSWSPTVGIEWMAEKGSWQRWLKTNAAALAPLAKAAYAGKPKDSLGFLAQGDFLARFARCWDKELLCAFLDMGFSPNSRNRQGNPIAFLVTAETARMLAARGADLSIRGAGGYSIWEHRAAEFISGSACLDELDAIAELAAPAPGQDTGLGRSALRSRSHGVCKRMLAFGYGPEAFGCKDPADAARQLADAFADADARQSAEFMLALLGRQNFLAACKTQVSLSWSRRGSPELTPPEWALQNGRISCLGALEEAGAIDAEFLKKGFADSVKLFCDSREHKDGEDLFAKNPHARCARWIAGRSAGGKHGPKDTYSADLCAGCMELLESGEALLAASLIGAFMKADIFSEAQIEKLRCAFSSTEGWEGCEKLGMRGTRDEHTFERFAALMEAKALDLNADKPSRASPSKSKRCL